MILRLFAITSVFMIGLVGCKPKAALEPEVTLLQAAYLYPDQVPGLIASGSPVDAVASDGSSALWFSAQQGHPDNVKALLSAGADPNLPGGTQGRTPLHCTAFSGSADACSVARHLIDHGAKLNAIEFEKGKTPLHCAVRDAQSPKLVKLLLDAGANVDAQTKSNDTALHFAASQRNLALIELLLEAGAAKDVPNHRGALPHQLAPKDERIQTLFGVDQ